MVSPIKKNRGSKKKYDIEKGFISKIIEIRSMTSVKENQIKLDFLTGENKAVYRYIYDSVLELGQVPTERVIQQKFPNYPLEYKEDGSVGNEETIEYWCEEIRTKAKHNRIAKVLEQSVDKITEMNTEEAYNLLKNGISYIENEIVYSESVDITKNIDEHIERYKMKKDSQGMIGIPTGIKHLDYLLGGLQKDTLTTIIAGTGIGKTWLEILIGSYCVLQNCRVLQYVTEMPTAQMQDRYDAMLFGMTNGEINYNKFRNGQLTLDMEKKYFDFLQNDLANFESLRISTATGVMAIAEEIKEFKPDLVLIDGVYLMDDDQGSDSDWLRVAHITRDLKKLAKRTHLPIVANSQADKNTSKKTGPGLESISYTQAIGQDSDNVISLFRDEMMINDREMCLRLLKQREGTLGKVHISWDFETMNFEDIYATNETGDEVDIETEQEEEEVKPKKAKTKLGSSKKGTSKKNDFTKNVLSDVITDEEDD